MKLPTLVITAVVALAASVPAYHWMTDSHAAPASVETHSGHADHMQHGAQTGHMAHSGTGVPQEGGQSAFAAIAEIVSLLEADPDTDWEKVDVSALREHLVDMNSLMLGAKVSSEISGDTITYQIEGEGSVLRAIHAMVPAHAAELSSTGPWTLEAETTPGGAVLSVTSSTAEDLQKARALGFFGLMARGSHHQPHHLAIAAGQMPH